MRTSGTIEVVLFFHSDTSRSRSPLAASMTMCMSSSPWSKLREISLKTVHVRGLGGSLYLCARDAGQLARYAPALYDLSPTPGSVTLLAPSTVSAAPAAEADPHDSVTTYRSTGVLIFGRSGPEDEITLLLLRTPSRRGGEPTAETITEGRKAEDDSAPFTALRGVAEELLGMCLRTRPPRCTGRESSWRTSPSTGGGSATSGRAQRTSTGATSCPQRRLSPGAWTKVCNPSSPTRRRREWCWCDSATLRDGRPSSWTGAATNTGFGTAGASESAEWTPYARSRPLPPPERRRCPPSTAPRRPGSALSPSGRARIVTKSLKVAATRPPATSLSSFGRRRGRRERGRSRPFASTNPRTRMGTASWSAHPSSSGTRASRVTGCTTRAPRGATSTCTPATSSSASKAPPWTKSRRNVTGSTRAT